MFGLQFFPFYCLLFSVHVAFAKPRYSNNSPTNSRRPGASNNADDDSRYDPRYDQNYDPNYDPNYNSNQGDRVYVDTEGDPYATQRSSRYKDNDDHSNYARSSTAADQWSDDSYDPYSSNRNPVENGYTSEERNEPQSPRSNRGPIQKEKRIVEKYTKSLPSLVLVACSSSIFTFLASTALLNFMLSKAPIYATLTLAVVGFLATYVPGEAGSFSRSSGIFLLLLAQRASLHAFLGRFARQLLALISLTRRAGFPWAEDPWKYRPRGPKDIDFNMTSTMIASVLLGGVLGWSIGRCIPLLPNWIGTLTGVGFLAYMCTMPDTLGDLVRFLSYSLAESYGEIVAASREVGLTDEISVLLSRALNLFKLLDRKFQLIPKLQAIFAFIMGKITEIIGRLRQQDSSNRSNGPMGNEDSRRDDY